MRISYFLKAMRIGALMALLTLLGITGWKVISDLRRPESRGLLVVGMLEEQVRAIRSGLDRRDLYRSLSAQKRLSPDCDLLRRWLIAQSLSERSPSETRARLERLRAARWLGSELRISVERWDLALRAWEDSERKQVGLPSRDELLAQIRGRLHEAEGFRRIGRGYDGAVYYVWALQLVRTFLERAALANVAEDKQVPEALVYAGLAWARIGEGMPESGRYDQILHMISEFFPDTVWAVRANEHWNLNGVRHDA